MTDDATTIDAGAIVEPLAGHTGRGIPYALPGDALTDWPATSLELANLLDLPVWTRVTTSFGYASANWTDYDTTTFGPVSWTKGVNGHVAFRGMVSWGQGVAPTGAIFTLPADLLPRAPIRDMPGYGTFQNGSVTPCLMRVSYTGGVSIVNMPIIGAVPANYTGTYFTLSALHWMI